MSYLFCINYNYGPKRNWKLLYYGEVLREIVHPARWIMPIKHSHLRQFRMSLNIYSAFWMPSISTIVSCLFRLGNASQGGLPGRTVRDPRSNLWWQWLSCVSAISSIWTAQMNTLPPSGVLFLLIYNLR